MSVSAVSTTPTALAVISLPITNQITVSTRMVMMRALRVGLTFRKASTPASAVRLAP